MRLNKLKKIMLWVLLTPVVLITSAILYYQFDEALQPEVLAMLNYLPEPVAVEQNGYFPLLGLFAPADVAPQQKGLELVAEAKKLYEEKGAVMFDKVRDTQGISLRFGSLKVCEDKQTSHCLRDIRKNKTAYKTLVADNQLLLTRYRAIHHYAKFQESSDIFGFFNTLKMNRLAQADISLKWDAKNHRLALILLHDENDFWRKVINSDVSLIARMIGIAILQRNLYLTAELLSDCSQCVAQSVILDSLGPVASINTSLRKVYSYEAKHMYRSLATGIKETEYRSSYENILFSLIYKKNAAANKILKYNSEIIRLSECPSIQYVTCYPEYKNFVHRDVRHFSLEYLDDPLGKTLANIAIPNYDGFVFAAIQHEALRRLVLVKYHLGKDAIKPEAIESFLQTHNQEFGNPITGKPIEWDAKQRILRMSFPAEIEQQAIDLSL